MPLVQYGYRLPNMTWFDVAIPAFGGFCFLVFGKDARLRISGGVLIVVAAIYLAVKFLSHLHG